MAVVLAVTVKVIRNTATVSNYGSALPSIHCWLSLVLAVPGNCAGRDRRCGDLGIVCFTGPEPTLARTIQARCLDGRQPRIACKPGDELGSSAGPLRRSRFAWLTPSTNWREES